MSQESEFEASFRRGRRIRLGIFGAIVCSPIVYVTYRFWYQHHKNVEWEEKVRKEAEATPEQVAELEQLIPELRTKLAAASAQIKADVTRDKLDAALAGDGGRCPYDVAREFGLHDDLGKQLAMMDHHLATDHVDKLPLTIDGLDGPRGDLETAAEDLANDRVQKSDVEAVEKDVRDFGGALIVVGSVSHAITVAGTYTPGRVDGDAFLYIYRDRAIACAGHIFATTPESVMVEYTAPVGDVQAGDRAADAKLDEALYDAEAAALVKNLHAVR